MCVLLLFSAKLYYLCPAFDERSDARVAEEARLESVYTSKAYPEFESRSLRHHKTEILNLQGFPFVVSRGVPQKGPPQANRSF